MGVSELRQSGTSPTIYVKLAARLIRSWFAEADPVAIGPPPLRAGGRKVHCFSRAALAPGRPWALNLRGALRVDDASPTVPVAVPALLATSAGGGKSMVALIGI
jgi:hypothetical protein